MVCFYGVFALKTNSFRFSGLSEEIGLIIADVAGGSTDSMVVTDLTAVTGLTIVTVLTVVIAMIDAIADVAGNGILLWWNAKPCSA